MKIIHIGCSDLSHGIGGIGIAAAGFAQAEARAGHEVEFLYTDHKPEPIHIDGVTVKAFRYSTIIGNKIEWSAEFYRYMASILPDVDVVHCHGLWRWPHLIPAYIKIKNYKLVCSPHGVFSADAMRFSPFAKKISLALLGQGAMLKRVDIFHATSEAEADQIKSRGLSQPISLVPLGVEPTNYTPMKKNGDKLRFVFLGRIHKIKGIELLLESWSRTLGSKADCELHIVGPEEDPEYTSELKKFLSNSNITNVYFQGVLRGPDKINFLLSCDILTITSHSENFSLVVSEALSLGLPVIATEGVPWPRLNEKECGWWISRNSDTLGALLLKIHTIPREEILAMGQRGKSWMEEEYSWSTVTNNLLSDINSLKSITLEPCSLVQLKRIGASIAEVKKLYRYVKIYGLRRALFKAAGRKRIGKASLFSGNILSRPKTVGVIGCGQFAFASLGALLEMYAPARFARCFDINPIAQTSFENFFDIDKKTTHIEQIFSDPSINLIYVVSNHATHADYAKKSLEAGKTVYVEKPMAVTWEQLSQLSRIIGNNFEKIYCGYNRPFAGAIKRLKKFYDGSKTPLTLNFYIVGHLLAADHWYRNSNEGGRICGNIGHWLDLAVHILAWGELPDKWKISLIASDDKLKDENVTIVMVSERGDIITWTLTSRNDPFEGVNESVMLQWGSLSAKIDDFREMKVWQDDVYKKYSYWPKDVGHRSAILQPFTKDDNKASRWHEVKLSTALMLRIEEMLFQNESQIEFSFSEQIAEHNIFIT